MFVCMGIRCLCAAVLLLLACLRIDAQDKVLAPTPPMGWNSWDSYGLTVNEAQFRANMVVMAAQLKEFGWQYVVVDEGWYLENPENASIPQALR
jgi:alpha-galactosidase